MAPRPHPLSEREQQLFANVRQWTSQADWRDLDAATLRKVSDAQGIDFATTLLYDRLRNSTQHGAAIRGFEEQPSAHGEVRRHAELRVAIVPGGCHEESADSRECLQIVHRGVRQLGFEADIVPTASFGSIRDNARIIQQWITGADSHQLILVSLSKGSAEVKLAINEEPRTFDKVLAWVNVSGLLFGSEWVRWLLDRTISNVGARGWCWYWGYRFRVLQELRRGAGELLDPDVKLPDHLRAMHLVGFPLSDRFSHPYTARSFRRLTPHGPSDGMGIMLGDLVRLPGTLLPVWRADHFLRPGTVTMEAYVGRVLQQLSVLFAST